MLATLAAKLPCRNSSDQTLRGYPKTAIGVNLDFSHVLAHYPFSKGVRQHVYRIHASEIVSLGRHR